MCYISLFQVTWLFSTTVLVKFTGTTLSLVAYYSSKCEVCSILFQPYMLSLVIHYLSGALVLIKLTVKVLVKFASEESEFSSNLLY